LIAGVGVALVGWFGSETIGKRLGTLGGGEAFEEGRRALWERTLPLALRFPAWGTGYGTFVSAEPQQRQPDVGADLTWEHAHNDYLEALVEGGFVQLALVLAALGLVFRAGVRAHHRLRGGPDGALVLGGLFGFTAVALHSLGDFGLHMPAIVVLVTVLAAHLVAAADPPADRGSAGGGWRVLPVVAVCLLVAALLPVDGWRRERAEHFRLAAIRAEKRLPAGERDPVVEYLRTAVEFTPDDATLRLRLADVRYEEYLTHRDRPPSTGPRRDPADTDLKPALKDYLRVREANPLLPRPHVRLAGARQYLTHPDSVVNYLDRATRLRPTDPGLWYLAGLSHLDAGDPDRAWDGWRRSLVCSPAQLETILPPALARLGGGGLVERVLPPNPEVLVAAARTPALVERPADRRVVLTRALELLGDTPSRPDDLYMRAWILRQTGRSAEAVRAYELAVGRAPDRVEWRYELAELCYERGALADAAEHLRGVLRDRPDLPGARELHGAVVRGRGAKP
jgi:tetratricopeptide (TPR) repeat protein